MKIGEVCNQTGLTVRTIRFYIEEGLIVPDKNRNKFSGRANIEFKQKDLDDLAEIMVLRSAALTLSEIKALRADKGRVFEFALKSKQLLLAEIKEKSEVYEAIGFVDETLTYEQFIKRLKNVKTNNTAAGKNIALPVCKIIFLAVLLGEFLFNSFFNLLIIGLGSPIGFTLLSGIAIGVMVLSTAGAIFSFIKPQYGFIYLFLMLLTLALMSFSYNTIELSGFWLGVFMLMLTIYLAAYLLQMWERKARLNKK